MTTNPTNVEFYKTGKIKSQLWYKTEFTHNDNGPSKIYYSENVQIKSQEWFLNGRRHNENWPAETRCYKEIIEKRKISINIIWKNWLISKWNGKHREFLTQVLTVPENHNSPVGKLFPNGGYDYKKFKESLLTF
jgi:antitoxin component YwqK of YwqJK toxin-antitoxin module